MQDVSSWLERNLGLGAGVQLNLLLSLAVLFVLLVVRWAVLRLVSRLTEDVRVRYRWKKATAYLTFFAAVPSLARIWFQGFPALGTYLGLVSAGIAIALREPLTNLAGWAFIMWRKPFEAGDRIQIGEQAGDVIDRRIFQFTLMEIGNWVAADQSTGRVVHVPNGKVFTEPLYNYATGFQHIWNEIPVLVTFESDWEEAKAILSRIAEDHAAHLSGAAQAQLRKAARKFMIFYTTLTPTVYTSVEESGVLLTIRYLCQPRQRRGTAQAIWEDVLRAFAERDDIEFAYPTQRFYDNGREGRQRVQQVTPASAAITGRGGADPAAYD